MLKKKKPSADVNNPSRMTGSLSSNPLYILVSAPSDGRMESMTYMVG